MWPFTSLCQALRNCRDVTKTRQAKIRHLWSGRWGVGRRVSEKGETSTTSFLLSSPASTCFFFLKSFHDLCSWLSWSLEQATFNTVAVLAPYLTPNLEDREITPCLVCTAAVWSLLTLALGVTEWEMYIPPPLGKVAIPWRQKEKDSVISYNLGSI